MFTDLTGKRRYKICLHCHTSRSDGQLTYEEVLSSYARAGYDMLAVTDHWVWNDPGEYMGALPDGTPQRLRIVSGCEYNVGSSETAAGVFHILALDCPRKPNLNQQMCNDTRMSPVEKARILIKEIHRAGGLAVLAHPAWSLNTPDQIFALGDVDATEIYNSVSDWGMSDRPYAGIIVDQVAARGMCLPLIATDDSHYYNGDQFRGMIMAEATAVDREGLGEVIAEERFYATMGPEVHLERVDANTVRVRCSPAVKIVFPSNLAWTAGRILRGEGLTEALYTFKEEEHFVRAEAVDAEGRVGWSCIEIR